ncbi:MAG TPA: GPW/gp25 family protein [Solirubrobacteraceae bacterium]|nr:GPW/gp25 family protein [Solirubrobacteraceae bacterium]
MTALAVAFPLQLDDAGSAELVSEPALAAEQLMRQLLFTAPGERLNQPTLGCGLRELVFAPLSPELQAASEFQIGAALQRFLGDVVSVISLSVLAADSALEITIVYRLAGEEERRTVTYTP